eukprot:CAMPEP_0115050144 /NCGR_PEP_ID=MMETSP0227-20121206/1614_1 /TAXON_ID=89957 /ORGANISM="Polarella glacialis, Strain CCMP 1383" /LENGTH=343 /DNA_ID=CAMNT_0002433953 /DNA_START=121 /DNA_END=1149 /DNA_ORIENTATION=+
MEQGEFSWIKDTGRAPVFEQGLAWRYTTALHWSLTQFTPASISDCKVNARNVPERVMSILVLFFSLITFSSIVGSVTNSMTALRDISGGTRKQFWLLRRFLKRKQIGLETRERIIKFLEHKAAELEGLVPVDSIKILALLSQHLKNLLAYELIKNNVELHPFFRQLELEMTDLMIKVCHTVLENISLASEDVLFNTGEEAAQMYFVSSGDLEYQKLRRRDADRTVVLQHKAWVSEAILWTSWWHRGACQALTPCDLIAIKPGDLAEVMKVHPRPWRYCKRYANHFVEILNETDPRDLSDVQSVERTDHFSLFASELCGIKQTLTCESETVVAERQPAANDDSP